jgi:hypothetical protein
MNYTDLRNVAIIAHVDHGKTNPGAVTPPGTTLWVPCG